MSHEFLHHLTQANLPVIIYSENLVKQLCTDELQGLLITAEAKSFQGSPHRLGERHVSGKNHQGGSPCSASTHQSIPTLQA